ncbi:hypothetical protein [Leptospira andrefontaineae]|uniref:Uncharacterized protein n=1 Tax=Leptospira andrefontaineae TaxID=2484976 RepID=A0A4R9GX84_9LEPT|nr:hypothetical protein [Leptospira andrefontaineae]TGK36244.1 hypothetical protein EHO65_18245 [Leptospira andrefontaineae]
MIEKTIEENAVVIERYEPDYFALISLRVLVRLSSRPNHLQVLAVIYKMIGGNESWTAKLQHIADEVNRIRRMEGLKDFTIRRISQLKRDLEKWECLGSRRTGRGNVFWKVTPSYTLPLTDTTYIKVTMQKPENKSDSRTQKPSESTKTTPPTGDSVSPPKGADQFRIPMDANGIKDPSLDTTKDHMPLVPIGFVEWAKKNLSRTTNELISEAYEKQDTSCWVDPFRPEVKHTTLFLLLDKWKERERGRVA